MRFIPIVAGILLGLLFLFASLMFFFGPPPPAMPEGSPGAQFMGLFVPSGYLTFIKVCELLGGLLVAIPLTRNIGLLFLGPIILNILAFQLFIMKGSLLDPMLIFIIVVPLYLLWVGRKDFLGLLNRGR